MTEQQPAGSLATALANAKKLLAVKPARAEEQAREILKVVPGHPMAVLLLASARRAQNDDAGAFEILQQLARVQPNAALVQYEFGMVMGALGKNRGAVMALTRAADLEPATPAIWRALGDQYTMLGETAAADRAYAQNIKTSVNDPKLIEAATALVRQPARGGGTASARIPESASHRRLRDPHAGRDRRALGTLCRRGETSGARFGVGTRLRSRAA